MKRITIFLLLFIMTGTVAYSQVPQDFEGGIPSGWTTYNNSFGSTQWNTVNAVTNPPIVCEGTISAFVISGENIGIGNTSEKWLVSSQVTIPDNGQLVFSTRSGINGFQNTTYQIRVSTVNQFTGFQIVASWSEAELTEVFNICEDKTVDLVEAGFSSGQNVYIAFVMLVTQPGSGPTGDRWIVDDVRLVERCINPENIVVGSISQVGATITWDNLSGAQLFEVEIVEFPNTPTGVGVQVGPAASYSPNDLNPSTQYAVYVRAICSEINSEWVGPTNFLTSSTGVPSNGINIYNSNGALPENRKVELDGFNLNFVKGGRVGVGTNDLFSKFTIGDDTDELFTEIEPAITDVRALFEIKSNEKRGKYYKFNISQYKDVTWMQSSLSNRDASTLSINPLKGNVGIGVLDATAQLHTINSVRFEDLPFVSEKPIAVLGTDIDGNVFNYDPNQFGGGGTTQDAWLLNGNALTNPGTGAGQNFIGTTDAKDLVFGVANDEKMRITQSGRLNFYNHNGGLTYARNLYIGGGNDNAVVPTTSNFANVAVGVASLSSITTGNSNTVVGNNALRLNSSGNFNSSFGADSSRENTTGNFNSSFGANSSRLNTTGNSNSSFGNRSLELNLTGSGNTAIGNSSLTKSTGNSNTAVGSRAGFKLASISSHNNVFVGSDSGLDITNGSNNIFIGFRASGNGFFTQGNSNILIGNNVLPTSNNVNNELNIGNWIFGRNGQIAIGSFTNLIQAFNTNNNYQLIVRNGIRTEKVRVDIASEKNWSDHVFDKEYSLLPLNELEKYISANGHLPNIPKAEEVVKEGIDLGEMNAKLLEKVEELTLHSIELNKKNESQQKLIDDLIERLEKLEKNTKQ